MVDSNYTHILAIIDRSGSMSGSVEVMTSALNEFFQDQATLDGKCLVDYVEFGTTYNKVYEDRDVSEAEAVFNIQGMTALLDAIGRGTTELGVKLRSMREKNRPGTVMVVVVTDGHENSSREWTAEGVKQLITVQQDKYEWDYVFLGANIDAVATGNMYGFKPDKSLTFNIHNGASVIATSSALRSYAGATRSGKDASFSDAERAAANGS